MACLVPSCLSLSSTFVISTFCQTKEAKVRSTRIPLLGSSWAFCLSLSFAFFAFTHQNPMLLLLLLLQGPVPVRARPSI